MSKKEVIVEEEQEESSVAEEQSYEAEFDALWGNESANDDENSDPEQSDESEEEVEVQEEVEEEVEVATDGDTESTTTTASAEPADPYSWIDTLPEEVREQAKQLKRASLSHQGRAAAFQRRADELKQELDRARQEPHPASPADRASKAESAAPELPDEFKKLKEDFPEFAEAVEAIRRYDREQYRRELEQHTAPLREITLREQRSHFDQAVTEAAREIFNTDETGVDWKELVAGEDFAAWLSMQPPSVQEAASKPNPMEAIHVLRRYEDDYQRAVKLLKLDQPDEPVSKPSTQADKVKEKRAKQQQRSVAPGSKPAAVDPKHGGAGDYEAEFNAMWA